MAQDVFITDTDSAKKATVTANSTSGRTELAVDAVISNSDGNSVTETNPFFVREPSFIDTNNSSTTTLDADAAFTGTASDILHFGVITVAVYSDVASATDGLSIQQSTDGTNWDHTDEFTIPANTGKTFSVQPTAMYFRIVYTNGPVAQTEFRLQVLLHPDYVKPSSHRIKDNIVGEDDAELVKAAITGEDENGDWQNVQTTVDGDLKISDNSSGLSIAEGNVTGKTFIHKFGQAPDFDIGDNFVTIWDGANDSTFSGSPPMNYTFSTTTDIDTISSSNAGDNQDIEIQGLDGNYNLVTQTVTLNGQSKVTLGTSLLRVFRMKNVGTTDLAGFVYCYVDTTISGGVPTTTAPVRAIIQNGNNQTLMAVYTVPAGKTGYLRDWYAAQANTTGGFFSADGSSTIKLKARPFGQVFQLKHISTIKSDGTGSYQHKYEEPEVFAEKTDIIMESNTSVNGAAVAAGFDIVLVDD